MLSSRVRPLLALCCLLIASPLLAQDNLLYNGDFAGAYEDWSVPQSANCVASVVPVELPGFQRALRLVLKPEPGANAWAINLNQSVDSNLLKGHRVQMRVWMRSPQGCRVFAYLERARDPWEKSLSGNAKLTPQWQEFVFEGKLLADFSSGGSNCGFHLGFDPGTVELTGVRLFDLDAPPVPEGARPTMDKPVSLIRNGDFSGTLEGNWSGSEPGSLKITVLDERVARFAKVVRLQTSPPENPTPWSVQLGQPCTQPVRKGDAVYFRAWLRSPDKCRLGFVYEMATEPHHKYIMQVVTPTPQWQEYRFLGVLPASFLAGQHQAKFFLGYDQGTVEVAGVQVLNYGRVDSSQFDQTIDYWGGQAHPDDWRAPALQRIEQLRKGDLTVRVVDAAGRPVPGATLHVEQQRHHFRFGTAAPAARFVDSANPDNVRFQAEVARLFNTVTFENDLKWTDMSESRLRTVDQAAEWLRSHDIQLRGHCLLWGSYHYLGPAARELRKDALRQALQAHVTDYASRLKGRLYLWDVVNEAATNTEVWDEVGWESFADSYRWARAADPQAQLCYNDYNLSQDVPAHRAKAYERIRYLLDHGAPVDVLGDQGHMSVPLTPIHRVLQIWDELAQFGKDLEITEFDLGCADDKVHAAYVRDYLIAAFSHPDIKSFIQWGFWEGSHWRAREGGAMFRRDWSKRPAQEAYEDLVLRQWWTRWQGTSDAHGGARLRAFYGRHEVSAALGGKRGAAKLELTPGGPASVEIRLP